MKRNFSPSKLVCLFIMCLFFLTQLIDAPWSRNDGVVKADIRGYYAYLPALFIHNDLKLDDVTVYEGEGPLKIWFNTSENGIRYIKYPMGTAILYAPFFGLSHVYAGVAGDAQDGFSTPYMFALSMSALFYLLLALVFLRKILRIYFSETVTAITILVVFVGTNAGNYFTFDAGFSHSYSFSIITLFIYGAIKWMETMRYKYVLWVGVSAGLMTLIRPIDIVFIVFIPLLFVRSWSDFKERWRLFYKRRTQLLVMVLVATACVMPQLVYFKYISGEWLFYSYSDESFFFTQPKVLEAMFSFRNGWLIYSPLLVFALVGFFFIRKRNAGLFLPLIVVTAIYVFIISSWWCWWYVGFGNRAFINLYPFLSIPLAGFIAFVLEKKWGWRVVFGTVVLAGMSLSVFQTLQFKRGSIHWGHMSKKAYTASFLKWDPTPLFHTYLEIPNLEKAKHGKTDVYKRVIDTIAIKRVDFEDVTSFDTTHAELIQKGIVFNGRMAMFLPSYIEYALGDTIEVKNANRIHITAWVRNPEEFALCLKHDSLQFAAHSGAVVDRRDGWEKIELYSEIPNTVQGQKLLFFIWKINRNDAYIDDIKIILTHEKFVE